MDEEKKKRIAEFRFGVIADLIGHRKLSWGERGRLLEEKASQALGDTVLQPHAYRRSHDTRLDPAV